MLSWRCTPAAATGSQVHIQDRYLIFCFHWKWVRFCKGCCGKRGSLVTKCSEKQGSEEQYYSGVSYFNGSNMLAFSLTQCVFELPPTQLLAGRVCCCWLCGVKAVKGTVPTCSTSSGTKCELQVVSGAMVALEYPLLISVVSQTCFEMPCLPLLQRESPMTDCQSPRECCKVHPWVKGW